MIVLDVYSRDRTTFHGTVAEPHDGFAWSATLDGAGAGRVVVDAGHADAALLADDRLVVVRDADYSPLAVADGGDPDGELSGWWIESRGETLGDAWVADSIHGPETFAVLETAKVEPEGGIGGATTDKRWFGPMAAAYDPVAAGWSAAFSHGTVHEPIASQMASPARAEWTSPPASYTPNGQPLDWPDPDAEKLWDGANVDVDGLSPVGTSHFVRDFTIGSSGYYTLSVTSDNVSETYVDGIPTVAIGDTLGFLRTWRETVYLDAGSHRIYGRVQNLGTGPAYYAWSFDGGDGVAPEDRIRRSHTWVGHPEPVYVLGYPTTAPGMTLGHILDVLLTEAQARGELPGVTWTFDAVNDSDGVPWPLELELGLSIGTSVAKVAVEAAELGGEVLMRPGLVVDAYVRAGVDRSGTVDLTAAGVAIGEPQMGGEHRPVTRWLIRLEGGYYVVDDAAAQATYGVRTEFLSLGGIPEGVAAETYIGQVIEERNGPRYDTSMQVDPSVVSPWLSAGGACELGDDVLAPSRGAPAGRSMRMLAVAGKVDAGGVLTADVDLGA